MKDNLVKPPQFERNCVLKKEGKSLKLKVTMFRMIREQVGDECLRENVRMLYRGE